MNKKSDRYQYSSQTILYACTDVAVNRKSIRWNRFNSTARGRGRGRGEQARIVEAFGCIIIQKDFSLFKPTAITFSTSIHPVDKSTITTFKSAMTEAVFLNI